MARTKEEMKEEIKRLVLQSSPAPCRVLVTPLGTQRAVFITFSTNNSSHVTWRLLYKARSYRALLKKVIEHMPKS